MLSIIKNMFGIRRQPDHTDLKEKNLGELVKHFTDLLDGADFDDCFELVGRSTSQFCRIVELEFLNECYSTIITLRSPRDLYKLKEIKSNSNVHVAILKLMVVGVEREYKKKLFYYTVTNLPKPSLYNRGKWFDRKDTIVGGMKAINDVYESYKSIQPVIASLDEFYVVKYKGDFYIVVKFYTKDEWINRKSTGSAMIMINGKLCDIFPDDSTKTPILEFLKEKGSMLGLDNQNCQRLASDFFGSKVYSVANEKHIELTRYFKK